MKPGVFQGKKFPFTPKRRKKSLGSQCNNIIDTRHHLAAFRSKLANVSWLRSYIAGASLRARYRVWPRDGSVRTTKTSRVIARAMARGLGFVTPCPNKQGKNAYFTRVSDASGTASDVVNVRKDCKHFGPPLWVVLVEERGPFGGPS